MRMERESLHDSWLKESCGYNTNGKYLLQKAYTKEWFLKMCSNT